jgi:hypothetical protein
MCLIAYVFSLGNSSEHVVGKRISLSYLPTFF